MSCDPLPSLNFNGTSSKNSTPGDANSPTLNVWNTVATGVEVRHEDWKSPGTDEDTVSIVRFDLHHVTLQVAYQPAQPKLMSTWMQQKPATAIINGGYFDQQDQATGLVVSNGAFFGTSYQGYGGMLAVNSQKHLSLRSLSQQAYNPYAEQIVQATQSTPMLVLPHRQRAQFSADASGNRRSVVAMDTQGRLLFIASPNRAFSLDELADLLLSSDLSIDTALNLDGGSSTGLYVQGSNGSRPVTIDSAAPLPIVVIVKTL